MHRRPNTRLQAPPPPWRKLDVWPVGGLFQVGYADGSDLLLALSVQGRGIFHCLTGEKVARDYDEAHDHFDPIRLMAEGFGPLAGQLVRTGGLFGGGLPHTTRDGWFLEEVAPAWPTRAVLLHAPTVVRGEEVSRSEPVAIEDDTGRTLRAFGFSETGLSFVIATSADVTIFTRAG